MFAAIARIVNIHVDVRATGTDGESVHAVVGLRPPAIQHRQRGHAVEGRLHAAGTRRFEGRQGIVEPDVDAGDELERDTLPERILSFHEQKGARGAPVEPAADNDSLSIKQRTKSLEIDLITRALAHTKGNRTHAAKVLEISHRALLYKLKEYGLG